MKQCIRPKCGKSFEPATSKQQYCSTNCRVYHSKERKRSVPVDIMPAVDNHAVVINKQDHSPAISIHFRSFEDYQELKKECESLESWHILKSEILASPLTTKQKLFLTNQM